MRGQGRWGRDHRGYRACRRALLTMPAAALASAERLHVRPAAMWVPPGPLESGLRKLRAVRPRGENVRSLNTCSVDNLVDEFCLLYTSDAADE